jgi:hypothetical protein
MATVRGIALKLQQGMGRCWAIELAWDERGRPHDPEGTSRVVAWCDQPAVVERMGSGVCADHAVLFLPDEGGWSNN